tara:strand:+ start:5266 stop:5661 length:396 start_codon:yes stop_codon:yes gene_type:complete
MILLLMSLAFAEEPTYASLKKGQPAPFDGRLFNSAAVAEIITQRRLNDLDCDLEVEYQLDKAATKAEYEYDLLKAQCSAETSKFKELNQIKQDELDILRQNHKPIKPYLWLTGGFAMGAVTSIAIFKTVDQ